jgi:tetratricopeptide (TPR) repeat protein
MSPALLNVSPATPLPVPRPCEPLPSQPVSSRHKLAVVAGQPFSEENETFALACERRRGQDWGWIHQNADKLKNLRNLEGQTLSECARRKGDFLFALCLLKIRSIEELAEKLKTKTPTEELDVCVESARRIVEHFLTIPQPSARHIQEVSTLALAQDSKISISLLKHFGGQIKNGPFLDIHALKAFRFILENTSITTLKQEKDFLFKAVKIIFSNLEEVCLQDINLTCELLKVVGDICDKMEEIEEFQLPREELRQPLYDKLKELKQDPNASIVFDAAYALQSLVRVADDEPSAKEALRRAKAGLRSIFCAVKAAHTMDLAALVQAFVSAVEIVSSNQPPKKWHTHARFFRNLIRFELREDNFSLFREFVDIQEKFMLNRYVAGCVLNSVYEAVLEQKKNEKFWKLGVRFLQEMCTHEKWGSDRSYTKALIDTFREVTTLSDPIVFKAAALDRLKELASHSNMALRNHVREVLLELVRENKISMTHEDIDRLPIDPTLIDRESVNLFQEAFPPEQTQHLLEEMQREQQKTNTVVVAALGTLSNTTDQVLQQLIQALQPAQSPPPQHLLHVRSPHPDFVGREAPLNTLSGLLPREPDPTMPLAVKVLVAPAGFGKTELAIQFANQHKDHFSLIWFFHCETDPLFEQELKELGKALGLAVEKEPKERVLQAVYSRLSQGIQGKPFLLIFDNVEQPLPLPERGGVCLLTTRHPDLHPYPQDLLNISPFTPEETQTLYQKLYKKSLPIEHATSLTQKLEGYPVLIGLALRELFYTSIENYLPSLSQGGPLIQQGSDRYPQAMQKVISAIGNRLTQTDPLAFRFFHLCTHLSPDHISLPLLQAWLAKQRVEDPVHVGKGVVSSLINSSLMQYDPASQAFSFHRLTQAIFQASHTQASLDTALELTASYAEGFDRDQPNTWEKGKEGEIQLLTLQKSPFWETSSWERRVLLLCKAGGHFLEVQGEARAAQPLFETALKLCTESQPGSPLQAHCYHHFGTTLEGLGRHEEALQNFQRALEIELKAFGENHPAVAISYNNIGNSLQNLGRHEKALQNHQRALGIRLKAFGENHPAVAASYNNIGISLQSLGRHEEALQNQQLALGIWLKAFGENHPYVATSYNNIGLSLQSLGRHEKALQNQQRALGIWLKAFGENHPDVAASYNNIGNSFQSLGRREEALQNHQLALGIWLKAFGENHPDVADSYNNIGISLQSLGRHEEALHSYKQALFATWRSQQKESNPKILKKRLDNILNCLKRDPKLWKTPAATEIVTFVREQLGEKSMP